MENNIKAFKLLKKRYETITLNEIKNEFSKTYLLEDSLFNFSGSFTTSSKKVERERRMELLKQELTGFGDVSKCILCTSAKGNCHKCLYYKAWQLRLIQDSIIGVSFDLVPVTFICLQAENESTYNRISNALYLEELLEAYRARAIRMGEVLLELTNEANKLLKT